LRAYTKKTSSAHRPIRNAWQHSLPKDQRLLGRQRLTTRNQRQRLTTGKGGRAAAGKDRTLPHVSTKETLLPPFDHLVELLDTAPPNASVCGLHPLRPIRSTEPECRWVLRALNIPPSRDAPALGPCTTRRARSPCHVHPALLPVCYRPTVG
jgi:hypothetical protein